jgi:hypothetical protein
MSAEARKKALVAELELALSAKPDPPCTGCAELRKDLARARLEREVWEQAAERRLQMIREIYSNWEDKHGYTLV